MAITQEEYNKKVKTYLKVFFILIALTVFEGIVIYVQPAKLLQTLLIVAASLAKAVYVGWYYMHLNHETKLLKITLAFPLFVAFFYATYLIYDTSVDYDRHAHLYKVEPAKHFGARKFKDLPRDEFGYPVEVAEEALPTLHSEGHEAAPHAEESHEENMEAPSHSEEPTEKPSEEDATSVEEDQV